MTRISDKMLCMWHILFRPVPLGSCMEFLVESVDLARGIHLPPSQVVPLTCTETFYLSSLFILFFSGLPLNNLCPTSLPLIFLVSCQPTMCVDYCTIYIYSDGCINPDCNRVQISPGPDCPEKPKTGERSKCPKYELRHGASSRIKGKCPKHRV